MPALVPWELGAQMDEAAGKGSLQLFAALLVFPTFLGVEQLGRMMMLKS